MSAVREMIARKRAGGGKVLSVFLTAGYPTPAATLPLLQTLAEAGVDLIELGVPFSDPLADGPTIQMASQKALAAGTTVAAVLEMLADFKRSSPVPVLLMGYANPFMQFGWEKLVQRAQAAGAAGFIIPDLPPEESREVDGKFAAAGLDLIHLVSPNTRAGRVAQIDAANRGFIYAVSVTGVTGSRRQVAESTLSFLQRLRQTVRAPVLVGFGISGPETARRLAAHCDGVIIGSAVIDVIEAAANPGEARRRLHEFMQTIRQVL